MANRRDSQPKRNVDLVGGALWTFGQDVSSGSWPCVSSMRWEGSSVTAEQETRCQWRQKSPRHVKWDLEQGPPGGDGGWLPGQSAGPDRGNSNHQSILGRSGLRALQSPSALLSLYTLGKLRSIRQSKSEMPLDPPGQGGLYPRPCPLWAALLKLLLPRTVLLFKFPICHRLLVVL